MGASGSPIDAPDARGGVPVTVIIKALNEEKHIDAAVSSALAAVARAGGGEVILADSGSTDRTVEIAARHPITIVQLRHRSERRCGIGPQLGYQRARGAYIYILDGDMELDPEFLPRALEAMAADAGLAGVGGLVEEESDASYQFRGRKRRGAEAVARDCQWLDMGGLYRESALRQVGYFSNRNLHAYEEMDLGLRLGAAGWTLRRIEARSVLHHGRPEGNWGLLARRWRSRYLDGAGELLRAAVGQRYFLRAAATQRHLFMGLLLWLGLIAGLLLWRASHIVLYATLAVAAWLVLWRAMRSGSLLDAAFGQVVWQVTALAMVRGFFVRPRNPRAPVEHVVLKAQPQRDGP
jgi:glycosyltransferase involved in cell wall biosynthesis